MPIDQRTRVDGQVERPTPTEVFDELLPALLAARPEAVASAERLALRSLAVEVDGRTWTLARLGTDRIEVRDGLDHPAGARRAHVRLSADQLADLITDQVTPVGLMTAGVLDMDEGRIGHLLDWWLVLRAVLDDRRIHQPGDFTVDPDACRSHSLDDDPAELRAALDEAGFLHLRGAFDPALMEQISADMDRAAPTYAPDDGQSWWAELDDGSERAVRLQGFDRHSEAAAGLLESQVFDAVGAIPGCGHVHMGLPGNRVEALFKPLGVARGISDVPWHKDCSLGRHSYECSSLTVGISVSGAGPTSGQLRVVAGSNRAFVWPSLLDPSTLGLPDLALPTETGDLTVHLSCTLHMAQPPTERERRVLYTSFRLPPADAEAAAEAQRRLLGAARESAPLTTSQEASVTDPAR